MKTLALLTVFLTLPWLAMCQSPLIRDVENVGQLALNQVKPDDDKFKDKGRGHVTPPNIAALYKASWDKWGKKLKASPDVTALEWDCRKLGFVTPVDDQGNC